MDRKLRVQISTAIILSIATALMTPLGIWLISIARAGKLVLGRVSIDEGMVTAGVIFALAWMLIILFLLYYFCERRIEINSKKLEAEMSRVKE